MIKDEYEKTENEALKLQKVSFKKLKRLESVSCPKTVVNLEQLKESLSMREGGKGHIRAKTESIFQLLGKCMF